MCRAEKQHISISLSTMSAVQKKLDRLEAQILDTYLFFGNRNYKQNMLMFSQIEFELLDYFRNSKVAPMTRLQYRVCKLMNTNRAYWRAVEKHQCSK